ncbi:flagellar hook-basal body complex protein FliE [Marinospirillum sp. MEB164]|uniref:Flagellar hook-basal body complex protein FliE n=1 Tax=Marinospirillum alkalitolerans TaxID=3123374 RepID=A0ABW8PTZ6_9GAMM
MVERADISSVLSQIRSVRHDTSHGMQVHGLGSPNGPLVRALQEGGPEGVASIGATDQVRDVPSFATMLRQAIDNVNGHQQTASDLRTRYELGDPDVDIVNVMVASQKASVAFDAMSQVRNRLVNAYQEIMRMPV